MRAGYLAPHPSPSRESPLDKLSPNMAFVTRKLPNKTVMIRMITNAGERVGRKDVKKGFSEGVFWCKLAPQIGLAPGCGAGVNRAWRRIGPEGAGWCQGA